jgi:hypothetical protein
MADNEHDAHRSATTGRFVKENTAERHPSTTETQTR